MKKVLFLTLLLSLSAAAQTEVDPNGPGLELQGQRGRLNLGSTSDGRQVVQIHGQRGSLKMRGPSPSWTQNNLPLDQGSQVRPQRRQEWSDATLSRGNHGELILSDPNDGAVVVEKGSAGKTRVQTQDGNFTIDNALLLELTRRKGRDVLLDQLQDK